MQHLYKCIHVPIKKKNAGENFVLYKCKGIKTKKKRKTLALKLRPLPLLSHKIEKQQQNKKISPFYFALIILYRKEKYE